MIHLSRAVGCGIGAHFALALGCALFQTGCGGDERAGANLFVREPEVMLHPSQPMVVDLRLELSAEADVSAVVPSDPGVVSALLPAPPGVALIRLRGLAPGMDYRVSVSATSESGRDERQVEFQTEPALPGFEPAFDVTGVPSFDYLLFDMSVTPSFSDGGLFAVDAAGTTRFYLHLPSSLEPPDLVAKVPAGVKLLPDGRLLYIQDHRLRIVNELGEIGMDVSALAVGVDGFHHDVLMLPNGNFLVLGFEFQKVNLQADGQEHYVAGDRIVELDPRGNLVWNWDSFSHLDPQRVLPDFYLPFKAENPRTGDLGNDWTHGNALAYRASDDSILLSMRHQDWVIKIDHKSGDIEWHLGNQGDFSLAAGRWFYHQHAPEWEEDGSLLLYDNGVNNPEVPDLTYWRSRPVRYSIDEKNHVAKQVWEDTKEKYACIVAGDANLLPNGNVVVLDTSMPIPDAPTILDIYSRVREVDAATGTWLWTFRTPDERFVFRAPPGNRLPGEALESAP